MKISRREFNAALTGAVGAAALGPRQLLAVTAADARAPPEPVQALKDMTSGIAPITDSERRQRIEKAQQLMQALGIGAIVIEPGTTMLYYTAVSWSRSERTFATVIPARINPARKSNGLADVLLPERVAEMSTIHNVVSWLGYCGCLRNTGCREPGREFLQRDHRFLASC